MNPNQMFERLKTDGGCIVSSNACSALEIACARACGDFAVDEDGYGFVLRRSSITGESIGSNRPEGPTSMNEESYDSDCSACERAQKDYEELYRVTKDLSMLVLRLARALQKASPDSEAPASALDYLKRKGLSGSPLRQEAFESDDGIKPEATQ